MSLSRFFRAVGRTIVRENVIDLAAQLAYYGILALFPFSILLLTMLGYLPIAGLADEIFRLLRSIMPREAAELFVGTIQGLVNVKRGWLLVLSLVGSIVTASGGISALITALDAAYGVEETRPWWRRQLMAVGLTLLSAVAIIIAVAGLILGPSFGHLVSEWFGLGGAFDTVWRWARWPAIVLALSSMLAFLYWACPNIEQKFKYLTPGSLLGVLLWLGASYGFNTYAERLGNYNATYGALGGGIVLLVWIYISSFIVIAGGVANAVIWCVSHPGESRVKACDTGEKGREPQVERQPGHPGSEPVPA
jgi:membrane protein